MQMKFILISVTLLLSASFSIAYGQSGRNSYLMELTTMLDSTSYFDAGKTQQIENIRRNYQSAGDSSPAVKYQYNLEMYNAYKIFKFDSAFFYAQNLAEIAEEMNDPQKKIQSKLNIAFILLSSGMYMETYNELGKINTISQPDSIKAAYYLLMGRYYYDLADYDNDNFFYPVYFKKAGAFLDSALAIFPVTSFEYVYYNGLRQMKMGDLGKAFINFSSLVNRKDLSNHQLALAASTLSYIYFSRRDTDVAIHFQVQAAIADIRSSTKETFAILNLSQLLFQQGDYKSATLFIKKAIDDATFYGARQRKVQVNSLMPIIQAGEINRIEGQRKLWIIYAAVVSIVLLLFIFLLGIIYRQNKKLENAKKTITEAHNKLHDSNEKLKELNMALQQTNADLLEVNAKLEEANKIKEEYVGYFFTFNAEFFQKIERFKKLIEEKIHYGKLNEVKYIVNGINVKEEREELLKSFDRAFLRLFPHFVEDFNALFSEENRIRLHDNELLNTDLRIYALIRLGIHQNEKIAEILEYSVKSIYAYKTKIRNRANLNNDEFDKRVMDIRSI